MTAKRSFWLFSCLLVGALAAWDVYLVVVGLPATYSLETPPGGAPALAQTVYVSYPPALLSLGALGVLALGLARPAWRPLAWVGAGLHLVVGLLLIFSLGFVYLAAAGVFVVALSLLEWLDRRQVRWLLVGLGGVAVLSLDGYLFGWTSYGPPFIALSVALLALIVVFGLIQRRSLTA